MSPETKNLPDGVEATSLKAPDRLSHPPNATSEPLTLKFAAKFVLAAAVLLMLPALWSLLSAIWSAVTTGQVLVLSVGRFETSRSMVPWPQGWARFVGPLALFASLCLWLVSISTQRALVWWLSALLAFVGILLLMYSQWFTSWRGVVWFCSLTTFIASAYYIGSRFGRTAMAVFMLATFALVGWQVGWAA